MKDGRRGNLISEKEVLKKMLRSVVYRFTRKVGEEVEDVPDHVLKHFYNNSDYRTFEIRLELIFSRFIGMPQKPSVLEEIKGRIYNVWGQMYSVGTVDCKPGNMPKYDLVFENDKIVFGWSKR